MLRQELEAFGLLVSCHPLVPCRKQLSRLQRIEAADLKNWLGRYVSLIGRVGFLSLAVKKRALFSRCTLSCRGFTELGCKCLIKINSEDFRNSPVILF